MSLPFRESEAIQYQLCMEIYPKVLTLGFAHLKEDTFFPYQSFVIEGNKDIEKADALAQILKAPIFQHDFGEVTLSIAQTRNTLVPVGIFNESNKDDIFKLNFTEFNGELDYNRIPELDIVNIYETPSWIKRKMVIALPRTRFFHQVSVLLKAIFGQPTFKQKIHLFISDQFFHLFITEKNNMNFFNTFTIENFDDILYHLLFVLSQKGISQEEAALHILHLAPEHGEWIEKAQTYFKTPIQRMKNDINFALTNQKLCV